MTKRLPLPPVIHISHFSLWQVVLESQLLRLAPATTLVTFPVNVNGASFVT
jgi:hypothetical protein